MREAGVNINTASDSFACCRAHCLDSIFCSSQPTLRAFRNASPEFADMALNCLENTIKEWQELERQGFKM